MALLDVFDKSGKKVSSLELNDAVFSAEIKPYLHTEIVNWQRASWRAGTQCAKTKAEVAGTTKKPFPQKGRGVARQGSARKNPHLKGGGSAFAPKPRSYAYAMPRSKRFAALTSVLSLRLKEGGLKLVDSLDFPEIKTKEVVSFMNNFGLNNCLILDFDNDNLKMSARNLANAKYLSSSGINVYDVLRFPNLILSVDAAKKIEQRLLG